jgi:hypothetical protein
MKVYMSFWTQEETFKQYQFINILKVALYYAKQHYNEINLITDYKGEQILKNIFKWNNISTELESLPKEYKNVWSLGKIKAYQTIASYGDPFLHLDYDVFLVNKLPFDLVNSDIFCQSIERGCDARYQLHFFEKYCINKFYEDKFKSNWAPNCGIIGGKDLDFFEKYSSLALKTILDKDNANFWATNYYMKSDLKACIGEQYYFAISCNILNKKIKTLFSRTDYNVKIHSKTGYIHLIRDAKNSPMALKNIEYLNNFIIK